jgi:hypothetical protein
MRVGVKFCGHCKMQRDMTEVYEALRTALPDIEFGYAAAIGRMDLLLVLNACPVACADHPPFDGPVMVVSPVSIDGWQIDPEHLLEELERRLTDAETG